MGAGEWGLCGVGPAGGKGKVWGQHVCGTGTQFRSPQHRIQLGVWISSSSDTLFLLSNQNDRKIEPSHECCIILEYVPAKSMKIIFIF